MTALLKIPGGRGLGGRARGDATSFFDASLAVVMALRPLPAPDKAQKDLALAVVTAADVRW